MTITSNYFVFPLQSPLSAEGVGALHDDGDGLYHPYVSQLRALRMPCCLDYYSIVSVDL